MDDNFIERNCNEKNHPPNHTYTYTYTYKYDDSVHYVLLLRLLQ